MTAYCDFAYYSTTYMKGLEPLITEAEFPYYEDKAERYVRRITAEKSDTYTEDDAVKMCTCAIAEKEYAIRNSNAQSDKGISSESVGEYSVSYKTNSAESIAVQNRELYEIAKEYLAVTGILYRGR